MSLISSKGPGYVEMDNVFVREGGIKEDYFIAVEPFTRLCFIRPLPNKQAKTLAGLVEEMIKTFKATYVRADMEFSSMEVLNLLDRHHVKVDLIPFEVKDYTRLATVNRFCRSLRNYRLQGMSGSEIEYYYNNVKPDRYYPKKATVDVTYQENVTVMNKKHADAIIPVRAHSGDTVQVKHIKELHGKEKPKWSNQRFRVMGMFQGRYVLARLGDRTGNIILRRTNEVSAVKGGHKQIKDPIEVSNLYVVSRIEECTDRKSNPITTLDRANKLDCWYLCCFMDGRKLWLSTNQVRFQSNKPTPAEIRFFGGQDDGLTIVRITDQIRETSERKYPVK